MIIKIARPNPTPVSSEGQPEKGKFRPEVSFYTVECTQFTHFMTRRDQLDVVAKDRSTELLTLVPDAEQLDYDEVCVLEILHPDRTVIVFDTVAYVCNDQGQTQERIQPQRKRYPDRLRQARSKQPFDMRLKNHKFVEARDGRCYECGLNFEDPVHTQDKGLGHLKHVPTKCKRCGEDKPLHPTGVCADCIGKED